MYTFREKFISDCIFLLRGVDMKIFLYTDRKLVPYDSCECHEIYGGRAKPSPRSHEKSS